MLTSQQDSASGVESFQKSTEGAAHVRIVADESAAAVDRELVVSTYFCKTAFTGASIGDTITSTQIIDVSAAPSTVSVIWRNQTTAADLAGAPSAANLTLLGSTALTDAQMRASAVPVSAASLPLPAGAALDATLTSILTALALVPVRGSLTFVTVELTRANNATPYGVNDVVSADAAVTTPAFEFANAFRANGASGYVVGLVLTVNHKSLTPRIRAHFFNDGTATVSGDNLPHRELYADVGKRQRYVDLPAMSTAGDTTNSDMSRTFDLALRHPVQAKSDSRSLWMSAETLDAVTFTALDKISATLIMDNN